MNRTHPRWIELSPELARLWGTGMSCSLIAEALGPGITKNMIIGRAHRMGLPLRVERKCEGEHKPSGWQVAKEAARLLRTEQGVLSNPGRRHASGHASRPRSNKINHLGFRKGHASPAPRSRQDKPSITDLRPGECKFAMNEDRPFFFCGAETSHVLQPWCDFHKQKVWAAPRTR